MINTPAAASAAAISFALPNRCSISNAGSPPATTCLMIYISASPTTPVATVASATCQALVRNACADAK